MPDTPKPVVATPAAPAPAVGTPPIPPKRSPGHRGADVKDTVAEMAAKAHEISLEAGSKMAAAMKDVVGAAAGLTSLVLESARDLLQYMVRRGQMTQEEADKLMREVEASHAKRKPNTPPPAPVAPRAPVKPEPALQHHHVVHHSAPVAPAKHAAPVKHAAPAAKKPAAKKPTMKPAAKKHAVKASSKSKAKASAKSGKRR
jgi:polyhydroxyalkanoate synthesis regulator phasin